jgi:hypothetical protein
MMTEYESMKRLAQMAEEADPYRLCIKETERYLWILGCAGAFALGVLFAWYFVL